jgi:hypothetical protein
MKTSNRQHILPLKETLNEELCDADHDGEQSAEVKRRAIVSIGPSSDNLKEGKKEVISTGNTACFL